VAGLHAASAFRSNFGMAIPADIRAIGRRSDRDWQAVGDCSRCAFA
jgi:hypothetical protein